jgi:hypothetical protein
VLHQKGNGVSAFAAAEALVNFLVGRNRKRRSFFVVKRTQAQVVYASLLKFYVIAHYFHNVDTTDDLLYGFLVDHVGENKQAAGWLLPFIFSRNFSEIMHHSTHPVYSLLALASGLLLFSCGPGQHKLELNPPANAEYTIIFGTKGTVEMTVLEKKVPVSMETSIDTRVAFDSEDSGRHYANVSFAGMSSRQKVENQEITISDSAFGGRGDSAFVEMLKSIKMRVGMDKQGKVMLVNSGTDSLMATLEQGLDSLPGETKAQVMGIVKPLLENDMITGMLQQCFHIYPAEKVDVGDTWQNEIIFESVFSLRIANKFKLLSINNGVAEIELKSRITPGKKEIAMPGLNMALRPGASQGQETNSIDLAGVKLEANFKGTQQGKLWAKMDTGIPDSMHITQNIQGGIRVALFELPMKVNMDTRYTIAPVSRK